MKPLLVVALAVGLGVGVGAGMTPFLLLHAADVSRSFLLHDPVAGDPILTCRADIDPVAGTTFSFHWWSMLNTSLGMWSCAEGHIVYLANGTGGSASYTAVGGAYMFGTLCTAECDPYATVAGNYTTVVSEF